MENANPIVPPQANQTAPVADQPNVAIPNPTSPNPEGNSKKMIIMLIGGVVVVLAIVGGIYYFLSRQQSTNQPQTTQTTTAAPSKPSLAQVKDALDVELDAINVSASDGDFQTIDSDLQKL